MHSEEYKEYTIDIEQDNDSENPRDVFDYLGTMICFHGRYNLGDEHKLNHSDFNGWNEVEKHITCKLKGTIILPLYLYDHSGITMNTTGFISRPWDSGQIGFIYITAEKIREEYSTKRISKKLRKRIEEYLVNEVKEYDKYLTGDVWYYDIKKDDEYIETCGGFYGYNYCLEEAKSFIDAIMKDN